MEWNRTKKRIASRRDKCGHKGPRMVVEGVELCCCEGSSSLCKKEDIRYLMQELRAKCEQVDVLKNELERLQQKPNVVIDARDMSVKTHSVNVDAHKQVSNNYTMNVVSLNGVGLMQAALKGQDVYTLAFQQLLQLPDSSEKRDLVSMFQSPVPEDQITFKREVVNLIEESVNNGVANGIIQKDAGLDNVRRLIDVEQESLSKQAKSLGMVEEVGEQ